jgi:hypothetical protein
MNSQYLNNFLQEISEHQTNLKNNLGEALLKTTNEEEKIKIKKILEFNEKVEVAIANKDLDSLQNLLNNADIN